MREREKERRRGGIRGQRTVAAVLQADESLQHVHYSSTRTSTTTLAALAPLAPFDLENLHSMISSAP